LIPIAGFPIYRTSMLRGANLVVFVLRGLPISTGFFRQMAVRSKGQRIGGPGQPVPARQFPQWYRRVNGECRRLAGNRNCPTIPASPPPYYWKLFYRRPLVERHGKNVKKRQYPIYTCWYRNYPACCIRSGSYSKHMDG